MRDASRSPDESLENIEVVVSPHAVRTAVRHVTGEACAAVLSDDRAAEGKAEGASGWSVSSGHSKDQPTQVASLPTGEPESNEPPGRRVAVDPVEAC